MANETTIKVNVDVDIDGLQDLSNLLDELSEKGGEVSSNLTDSFNEISESASQTSTDIDGATGSVDDLASSYDNAAGSGDGFAQSNEQVADSARNVSDSTNEAGDSVNAYADVVSGVASIGLAAEFSNTATAADNYKVSMAALETVARNNGVSMDSLSSAINRVKDTTAISGGQARQYFSLMMNMGVTNVDALSNSLIYLQGQSAITGGSIESMESSMVRLSNSSTLSARMLKSLGLSLEGIAQSNGMTVDELNNSWKNMTADERIQTLNNAMAQNADLVGVVNSTTSSQLAELEQAWKGLEIEVGKDTSTVNQAVLGLATGGVKALTGAVKNIPFASTFIGAGLAVGALVTGIQPALDTFNTLSRSVRNGIDIIKGFGSAVKVMSEAESISAGIKTLLTGATVAEEAATVTETAANTGATTSFLGLAASEWLALAPILLLIAAILILVGVLVYLYFTNDDVREAIDNFGKSLLDIGGSIINGFIDGLKSIIDTFINVTNTIIAFVALTQALFTQWIMNVVTGFGNFLTFMFTLPVKVGQIFTQMLNRAVSWAVSMINRAINTAHSFASGFVNGLKGLVTGFASELGKVWDNLVNWGKRMVDKAKNIGLEIVQAIINWGLGRASPGRIYKGFRAEMEDTQSVLVKYAPVLSREAQKIGEDIVSSTLMNEGKIGTSLYRELGTATDYTFNSNSNNTDNPVQVINNLNLEVGSVDSHDRVNEIVEVIRKELAWDNKTAGRTA